MNKKELLKTKNNGRKAMLILVIVVLMLGSLITNKIVNIERYNGEIKTTEVKVKPLTETIKKEVEETGKKEEKPKQENPVVVNGYEVIEYKINYRLDSTETIKGREAIITATLSSEERKYARFIPINEENVTSTIKENGKEIEIVVRNVETNKQNELMLRIELQGAPSGYKVSPIVSVREKTEEKETRVVSEEVKVEGASISGLVKDKEGNIKSGVEITLCKMEEGICVSKKVTYSKEDGSYTFSNLEEGRYKVTSDKVNEYILTSDKEEEIEKGNTVIDVEVEENNGFKANIRKYIKEIRIEENGNEKTYDYENVKKASISVRNISNAKVRVIYELVVKNTSNESGYVKVVKEDIPEGLKYDKEYKLNSAWEEDNGILYNKSLSKEKLRAGEEKRLEVGLILEDNREAKNYINEVSVTGEEYYKVKYIVGERVVRELDVLESDKVENYAYEEAGYNFKGWYKDKELTEKFNFNERINKDTLIYGKLETNQDVEKYTVTYKVDNEEYDKIEEVVKGSNIPRTTKENPEKTGYDFEGWVKEDEEEVYDFESDETVQGNITFNAKFKIKEYDVEYYKYNSEGVYEEEAYATDTVEYNSTIALREGPTRKYYTFKYWSEDKVNAYENNPVDGSKEVIKLYAVYTMNQCKLTIHADGETEEIFVDSNELVQNYLNEENNETGYTYKYYATDEEGNHPYSSLYPIGYQNDTECNLTLYKIYEPNQYEITLNNDGAEVEGTKKLYERYNVGIYFDIEETEEYVDKIELPEKEGYTFKGYYDGETKLINAEGEKETVFTNTYFTSNKEIKAKWTKNKYRVEYRDLEENILSENDEVEYGSIVSNYEPNEVTEVTGYTFTHKWTKEKGSKNEYSLANVVTENIVLYPIYEINKYKVTLKDTLDENYNEEITGIDYNTSLSDYENKNLPSRSKTGYSFIGWYSERTGGVEFTENTKVTNNITIYARYTEIDYGVIFHYNDNVTPNKEVNKNTTPALAYGEKVEREEPTREGYTFENWYTESELENVYDFNTSVTTIINLYAKWTVNKYTLTIKPNGGKYNNTEADTVIPNQEYNKETEEIGEPTREGYTFKGWDVTPEGVYNSVSDKVTMPASDVVLTAKWEINSYTLTVNPNGGSYAGELENELDYQEEYTMLGITKTGYTFAGWTIEDEEVRSAYNSETNKVTMPAKDVTIKATWTPNLYRITLDSKGAQIKGTEKLYEEYNVGIYFEEEKTTELTEENAILRPQKSGYKFEGYYKNETKYLDEDGKRTSAFTNTAFTENTTLEAKYEINKYTLTVDPDGGSYAGDLENELDYQEEYEMLGVTKTGYTFAGWTIEDEETRNAYNSETNKVTMPAKDVTIKATWEVNTYTVNFYDQGADGNYILDPAYSSQTINYNGNITRPNNPNSRPGYEFKYWSLEENGTSSYNLETKVTENINLYAVYAEKEYEVIYVQDEEIISRGTKVKYKGTINSSTAPEVSKDYYEFKGWKLKENYYNFDRGIELEDLSIIEEKEVVLLKADFLGIPTPTISHTPTDWTNTDVLVTITGSEGYTIEYKVEGEDNYQTYENSFTVSSNKEVYARLKKGTVLGSEVEHEIKNIDKIVPTVAIENLDDSLTAVTAEISISAADAKDEKDISSGLKEIRVYLNDELLENKITSFSEPFSYDSTYLISNLQELTTYRVKVEVEDNAGNIGTSEEIEFTTPEKSYIAQVIQIGDEVLDTPIKYETVQRAIDHDDCETNYCVIQLIRRKQIINEEETILDINETNVEVYDGQDITLDLNGVKLISSNGPGITNNGKLQLIDDSEEIDEETNQITKVGTGKVISTNASAIVNNKVFTLGNLETPTRVSQTSPVVEGAIYGVDTNTSNSTFDFYDGKVSGMTIAINGPVNDKPYPYNVKSEGSGPEEATLRVVADPEAELNKVYYTRLATAVGDTKLGNPTYITEQKTKNLLDLVTSNQEDKYYFKKQVAGNDVLWEDKSGNNDNGIIYGGEWTEDGGVKFSGLSNEYVDLGNRNYSNITLEIEAKVNSSINEQKLMGYENDYGYKISIKNDKLYGQVKTGHDENEYIGLKTNQEISSDKTLYTLTYDGTTLKIYENGILVGEKNIEQEVYSGDKLYAGSYLDGTIYNIRVYDRALSNEEILNNKNGNIVTNDLKVWLDGSNHVVSDTYVLKNNNQRTGNTTANSYLKLDLTNYDTDQILVVNASTYANIEWRSHAYAVVTESSTTPTRVDDYDYQEGRFINLTSETEATNYSCILEKGKVYYVHFGLYNENVWWSQDLDGTFAINNISLSDLDLMNDYNYENIREYGFDRDENGYLVSNNIGVSDSVAEAVIELDLSAIPANRMKQVIINTNISSEQNCDYGYIIINNSSDPTEYTTESGRIALVSGTDDNDKSFSSKFLPGGEKYYIHIGYKKDGGGDQGTDTFTIKNIALVDTENFESQMNVVNKIPNLNEPAETVKILKNITLNEPLEISDIRNVVLDLGGYSLSTNSSDAVINNSGHLKIIDSKYTDAVAVAQSQYDEEQAQYDAEYEEALVNYNTLVSTTNTINEEMYKDQVTAAVSGREYTIDDYVSDGIIMHLDGIEHGNVSDVWSDLSGNDNDVTINGATWTEDSGLSFDGTNYAEKTNGITSSVLVNETVEIVFNTNNLNDSTMYSGSNNEKISIGTYQGYIIVSSSLSYNTYEIPSNFTNNNKHKITVAYDGANYTVYFDNKLMTKRSNTDWWNANSDMYIGRNQSGYYFDGTIYNVKVYNKTLTKKEIKQNYNVDAARYNLNINYPTSNTSDGTITSTSESSDAYKLFDGDKETTYSSNLTEEVITWNMEIENTIKSFKIYGSSDSTKYPTSVTIEGSKDGENYTTISTQELEAKGLNEYNEIGISIDDIDSYKYYKYTFSNPNGIEINEIELEQYNIERELYSSETTNIPLITSNFEYYHTSDNDYYNYMVQNDDYITAIVSDYENKGSLVYKEKINVTNYAKSVSGTIGLYNNWSDSLLGKARIGFARTKEPTFDDFVSYVDYDISSYDTEDIKEFKVTENETGEYYFKIALYHNDAHDSYTVYGLLRNLEINTFEPPTRKTAIKQESILTGNITSGTGNTIVNNKNAYLEIDDAIINLDKEGTDSNYYSAIVNYGDLKLNKLAQINTRKQYEIGIANKKTGNILPSSGTITNNELYNVGIDNASSVMTKLSGVDENNKLQIYVNSGNDSYVNLVALNNYAESDLTFENIYIEAIDDGLVVDSANANITIKDCNIIGSAGINIIKANKLNIKDSNVKTSTRYNKSKAVSIDNVEEAIIDNLYVDNENTSSSDHNSAVDFGNGNITINGFKIDNGSAVGIANANAKVVINDIDISINGNYAILNNSYNNSSMKIYKGNLTASTPISNSGNMLIESSDVHLTSTGSDLINADGNLILKDVNIETDNQYQRVIYKSSGNLTILGNSVLKTTGDQAIYIDYGCDGNIIIGEKDGVINTEYPKIISNDIGIWLATSSSNLARVDLQIYDGVLTGRDNRTLGDYIRITDIEENSDLIVKDNENNSDYEDVYVGVPTEKVAKIGNTEYSSLKEAFNAVTGSEKTTIELLKDIRTVVPNIIDEGKNIELDINGKKLTYYGDKDMFTNNNKFSIKDSTGTGNNYGTGKIIANTSIVNNIGEELNIEKTYLGISEENSAIINRIGSLNIKDSYLEIINGRYNTYLVENYSSSESIIDNTIFNGSGKGHLYHNTNADGQTKGNIKLNNCKSLYVSYLSENLYIEPNSKIEIDGERSNFFYIHNYGEVEIKDSTTTAEYGVNYTNYSGAVMTISGGSLNNLRVDNSGTLNITGGILNIYNAYSDIINNNEGAIINMTGGIVGHTTDTVCPQTDSYENGAITNNGGIVNIYGGTVNSCNMGILNSTTGTVNVGRKIKPAEVGSYNDESGNQIYDDEMTTESPLIIGITSAVYNQINSGTTGTFNFYDGTLAALDSDKQYGTIYGEVTDKEVGYDTVTGQGTYNTDLYETIYLGIQPLARIGTAEFYSLADAVNDPLCAISCEIDIARNAKLTNAEETVNILSVQNIVLDLNGYTVDVANTKVFSNSGTLKIIDSEATDSKYGVLFTTGGNIVENKGNGTFTLEGAHLKSNKNLPVITNLETASIQIKSGSIYIGPSGEGTATEVINNTSSGTINISGGRLESDCSGIYCGTGTVIRSNNGTITLSGGKLIAHSETGSYYLEEEGQGIVLEKQSNEVYGTLIVNGNAEFYTGMPIVNYGEATLISGTITKSNPLSIGGNTIENYGILNIEDGVWNTKINNHNENSVINMSGGKVIAADNQKIIANDYGTVNITGGTVENTSTYYYGGYISSVIENYYNGTINITGGYIKGYTGVSNEKYNNNGSDIGTINIGIQKDTIINPNAALVGETNYVTLNSAISAVSDGGTIKLLRDIEVTSDITVSKNITIDYQNKYQIIYKNGASLVVTEGKEITNKNETPTIEGTPYAVDNRGREIVNFYNGTLKGNEIVYGPITSISSGYSITKDEASTSEIDIRYLSNQPEVSVYDNLDNKLRDTTFANAIESTEATFKVKVLRDLILPQSTGTLTVSSGKDISLYLEGNTIYSSSENLITNNANLTLTDSTANKGKLISYNNTLITNSGDLNIEKVYLSGNMDTTLFNNVSTGKITLNNTKIETPSSAIVRVFNNTSTNKIIVDNSNEVNVGKDMKNDSISRNSSYFIVSTAGEIVINGGAFNYSNCNASVIYNDTSSTLTITGGTFAIADYETAITNKGIFNISSGSISGGTNGYAINNTGTATITGGTYNTKINGDSGSISISNAIVNSSIITSSNCYLSIQNTTITKTDSEAIKASYFNIGEGTTINGYISINDGNVANTSIINGTAASPVVIQNAIYGIYVERSNNNINIGDNVKIDSTGTAILVSSDIDNVTMNIGNDDGYITQSPLLQGTNYGIYNPSANVTINVYDGMLIGARDQAVIGATPATGYKFSKTLDETGIIETAVLEIITEDIAYFSTGGKTFTDFQQAVNNVTAEDPVLNLTNDYVMTGDVTIPTGKTVNLYTNGHTITKGEYHIYSEGTLIVDDGEENSWSLLGAIRKFLNLGTTTNVRKNIIIYEMNDGSNLDSAKEYELQLLTERGYEKVDVDEVLDNVGRYNIATRSSNDKMTTINGKIYINNVPNGSYKVVDNSGKEVSFVIEENGTLSGNVKTNYTSNISSVMSKSRAELIVNIRTGQKVIRYGLLITIVGSLIILLMILRKKKVQE